LEAVGDVYENAANVQESTAFLPGYTFKSSGEEGSAIGTSLSGIIGGGITLLLAGGTGYLIYAVKRKKEKAA
ncbi:MAG: cobalamin biosynthesis protein CbiM, partial [Firmicutes bacterium HGW-Firmicutes-17]